MEWSDLLASLTKTAVIGAVALIWAGLVYGALGFRRLGLRTQLKELAVVALVFALLALVFGLVTAASRTAAVGQMVPAALGLIGAAALFLVTKEKAELAVTAVAVVSFSLMLIFGIVLGSYERLRAEAWQQARAHDLRVLKAQADAEFAINAYRKARGLDPVKLGGKAP